MFPYGHNILYVPVRVLAGPCVCAVVYYSSTAATERQTPGLQGKVPAYSTSASQTHTRHNNKQVRLLEESVRFTSRQHMGRWDTTKNNRCSGWSRLSGYSWRRVYETARARLLILLEECDTNEDYRRYDINETVQVFAKRVGCQIAWSPFYYCLPLRANTPLLKTHRPNFGAVPDVNEYARNACAAKYFVG